MLVCMDTVCIYLSFGHGKTDNDLIHSSTTEKELLR